MTLDLAKIKSDAETIASRCDTLLMPLPVKDVLGMLAEIERLKEVADAEIESFDSERRVLERVKSERDGLLVDASRYRWLRQKQLPLEGHDFLSTQGILDRRIDEAMAKEKS